jgi:hypothetical protein
MSKQLSVFDEADFSVENWLEEGRGLMNDAKDWEGQSSNVRRTQGALQWKIGDWLIQGEDSVKKKVLKDEAFIRHAVKVTKYRWGSLKNIMTIARQVSESRRRDGREGRKFTTYPTSDDTSNAATGARRGGGI